MILNVSPEECGYIAACSLYFRRSIQEMEVDDIVENLMILEQEGIGQKLLVRLNELLSTDESTPDYHG